MRVLKNKEFLVNISKGLLSLENNLSKISRGNLFIRSSKITNQELTEEAEYTIPIDFPSMMITD